MRTSWPATPPRNAAIGDTSPPAVWTNASQTAAAFSSKSVASNADETAATSAADAGNALACCERQARKARNARCKVWGRPNFAKSTSRNASSSGAAADASNDACRITAPVFFCVA